MWQVIIGILLIIHGLIHLIYFGQSARLFEVKPGLTWPDGSWAFSKITGAKATRNLAAASCVLAAVGFIIGGVLLFAAQGWWRPAVIASAAFSSVAFILLWDGKTQNLSEKGGINIAINTGILLSLLWLQWPDFAF